jgi:hypothetical protein
MVESRSESMHIDNVLAGRRQDEIKRDKDIEKERLLREKELKY